MDGIKPSTAPGRSREGGAFKVTHPFHPLFGRKFDLLTHRRNWGEDRVYYQNEDGGLRSWPAHWTDVVPVVGKNLVSAENTGILRYFLEFSSA